MRLRPVADRSRLRVDGAVRARGLDALEERTRVLRWWRGWWWRRGHDGRAHHCSRRAHRRTDGNHRGTGSRGDAATGARDVAVTAARSGLLNGRRTRARPGLGLRLLAAGTPHDEVADLLVAAVGLIAALDLLLGAGLRSEALRHPIDRARRDVLLLLQLDELAALAGEVGDPAALDDDRLDHAGLDDCLRGSIGTRRLTDGASGVVEDTLLLPSGDHVVDGVAAATRAIERARFGGRRECGHRERGQDGCERDEHSPLRVVETDGHFITPFEEISGRSRARVDVI